MCGGEREMEKEGRRRWMRMNTTRTAICDMFTSVTYDCMA